MNGKLDWIFKIIVASMLGAVSIKYVAPLAPIPATSAVALTFVFAPVVALTGVFLWRSRRSSV